MSESNNSGKIIRKNLIKMYPGSFLYAVMIGFMYMVDSILAGNIIGPEALSAVAIGLPGYGMFLALMNAVIHGTSLRVTWAKGRGDQPGFKRAFIGGVTFAGLAGLFFTAIIIALSRPLAMAFGGAKASEQILDYSILYIRCCGPMIFLSAISGGVRECIGVIGYQTERAILGIINMVSNVVFSVVFVLILPDDMKMAGLGIGSSLAALVEFISGILVIRIKKIDVSLKPVMLKLKEIGQTLKSGLPASLDNVIDCAVAAVVNNLILSGFPDEPMILSVVSVVNNIRKIIRFAPTGMGYAASPLYGIFYAERDKNSLKRTMTESVKLGIIATVLWSGLCFLALPLLSKIYGMESTPDIREGVLFLAVFMVGYLGVYLLTMFYESTERFGSSLIMASIPDSLLYPVMLAVMIPLMGKTGMWLAIAANPLLGLLLLLPVMMLLTRKNPNAYEKVLRLKNQIVDRSPEFDLEIYSSEEKVVGISEKINEFLKKSGKTARIANLASLCTEELAVDMVTYLKEHPTEERLSGKLLDIKLFDDGDTIEILIRSFGKQYNPLDFALNPDDMRKVGVKVVQKIADTVNYTYVYKLNVISIILGGVKSE